MRLTIPDEIVDTCGPGPAIEDIEQEATRRLRLMTPVGPGAFALVLTHAQLTQIATLLGLPGAPTSFDALVAAIRRVATLQIGHQRVDFTIGQYEELTHFATRKGLDVGRLLALVTARVLQDVFLLGEIDQRDIVLMRAVDSETIDSEALGQTDVRDAVEP